MTTLKPSSRLRRLPLALGGLLLFISPTEPARAQVTFQREFSPLEGMVAPVEKPFRQEICINGYWQFQPVKIPAGWVADKGTPPDLAMPTADGWEKVAIKIPSPWNVNALGHDRLGGGMDHRTYPSYPEAWNQVKMAWLRKSVVVPEAWKGQRIYLHLEAVAGDCRVLVNGKEAGFHFDTSLPGQIDITSAVNFGKENEILLGIRSAQLYSEKGTHGRLTYPTGSWLTDVNGVWQDVFLLAKPEVQVSDVFIQPKLTEDLLVAEVELTNNSAQKRKVALEIPVSEWINKKDISNMLEGPEIAWTLGQEALRIPAVAAELNPGEKRTVTLQVPVKGRLQKWEIWQRGKPNLYAAVVQLSVDGKLADKKYERFGWREVKLVNGDLLLNGVVTKMMHDGWHFTGVANMTRRYAWGWYAIAKEANVNLVRPHAMPYPRYFYDMADEFGMMLMDESGIFGSHCAFNYDSEKFWERNKAHIERLVRRDRNHPSVVGWSVSNEIRCVLVSRAPIDYQEKVYDKIFDLCKLARSLDPTRQWVQSDGDKDLNGRLDVWTIHCGGEHKDVIPPGKLWGVTEGGSSYYGKPDHYEKFVGDRAYRSFKDRMDALAKEDYNLIRTLREQDADIMNVWNLVWHAMKPLPIGLKDVSKKKLALSDGVFFADYVEGKPGVQPERVAPFSVTINPGLDPALPLYDPHPLYLAMKAAMHPKGPQPCEWDHFDTPKPLPAAPKIANPVEQAAFAGKTGGTAYDNLKAMGVKFAETQAPFLIVDLTSLEPSEIAAVKTKAQITVAGKGTVLLIGLTEANQKLANEILPVKVVCTEDKASSLLPNLEDPRTACLSYKELYFAENFSNKTISRYSLGGDLVAKGRSLLFRNNTEWLRWLNGPEASKTISIYRSELENTKAPVFVEYPQGQGRYLVSTLEVENLSDAHADLYRKLLTNVGLKLGEKLEQTVPALSGESLVRALVLGRFGAASVAEAMEKAFIDEAKVRPEAKSKDGGKEWVMDGTPGERFIFNQLKQGGPKEIYATYFSYWLYCPIDLSDLLNSGPDLPKVNQLCYVSDDCKVYLNGQLLKPAEIKSVDYRTCQTYNGMPLKQGWNHFLIKAASDSFLSADPGTLAVKVVSTNRAFDKQLKSAVQLPQTGKAPRK